MKAEQTRCPQEAGSVWDGVPRTATDPRSHRGNARSSDRLGRRLGGQSIPTPPRRWPGTQRCPVAGRAGRLTVRIVGGSTSPADRFRPDHDRRALCLHRLRSHHGGRRAAAHSRWRSPCRAAIAGVPRAPGWPRARSDPGRVGAPARCGRRRDPRRDRFPSAGPRLDRGADGVLEAVQALLGDDDIETFVAGRRRQAGGRDRGRRRDQRQSRCTEDPVHARSLDSQIDAPQVVAANSPASTESV